MPGDHRFGAGDDDSDLLRPSWQDTPDETDADRLRAWCPRPTIGQALPSSPDTWLSGAELAGLLVPLCDATHALRPARMLRAAAAAADAVRDGLRARMATAEAAGWLRPTPTPGSTRSICRFVRPASPPALRTRRGRARGAQPAADLRRCRRSVGLG